MRTIIDTRPAVAVGQLRRGMPVSIERGVTGQRSVIHGDVAGVGEHAITIAVRRRGGDRLARVARADIRSCRRGWCPPELAASRLARGMRVRLRRCGADYLGTVERVARTRALVRFRTARGGERALWIPAPELEPLG